MNKLYHITFENNLDNIFKQGLIPHTGLKIGYSPYPHRIYFLLDDRDWLNLGKQLYRKSFIHVSRELVLLEIDYKIIRENKLELNEDTELMFDLGRFIESISVIIPPKYIKIKERHWVV